MRSYAPIRPSFWQAEGEAKIIRNIYGMNEFMLYVYLLTSPHANYSGLYRCPIEYISKETGLTIDELNQAFSNLENINMVFVDTEMELVFIPHMLNHVVGKLAERDNKNKGIKSHINGLPNSWLIDKFCSINGLELPENHKPLISPLQAPTKGTFLSIPCVKPEPTQTKGGNKHD